LLIDSLFPIVFTDCAAANEDINKEVFKVIKLGKNNYQLLAGPYTSINTLKSDYFKLNKYGFDNLDLKKTK